MERQSPMVISTLIPAKWGEMHGDSWMMTMTLVLIRVLWDKVKKQWGHPSWVNELSPLSSDSQISWTKKRGVSSAKFTPDVDQGSSHWKCVKLCAMKRSSRSLALFVRIEYRNMPSQLHERSKKVSAAGPCGYNASVEKRESHTKGATALQFL